MKDTWAEDQNYSWEEWKREVFNGDTQLGYWEWLDHKKESDEG